MGGSRFVFSEFLVEAFRHFSLGFISFGCQMVCCLYVLSMFNLSLLYRLKIPSLSLSFVLIYGKFLSH